MTHRRIADLSLGLNIFVLVCLAAAGLISLSPGPKSPLTPLTQTENVLPEPETIYQRPSERIYAQVLARQATEQEERLRQTLNRLQMTQAPQEQRRLLILQSALKSLRTEAPYMRLVPVIAYDDALDRLAEGLLHLKSAGSHWCRGPSLAMLTRNNERDLVTVILLELTRNDIAFDWALDWVSSILEIGQHARRHPVRHGPRTKNDEAIVQAAGRQLGSERWQIALSIASFGQAEGRGFRTMRQAVSAINICDLGLTFEALSDRVAPAVRGRVMAELLPEVLYGNTPYVLYLVQGYFFIG